ncbi:hypothetical protein F5J12DRAFT_894173 [Pisolithus orientalis]|uniref:uncharacterized protein n=1 Tax=Pisolithus orientalis TaxID=936130 RepID=UPI0022257910|nr:uncharacterized protein F5J12DRAFT_894173 [Pisolithus orientalis]KAI6002406.1 hypothetical protein F5J12DRAFT_894173 [Pisolithus orientalis]
MPQLSNDDFFLNEEINIDREDNDSDNDSLETDNSEASDFEQMQRVLHDPGPTAEVHELQKALVIGQKAYTETCVELHSVQKELHSLSSTLSTHKCNHILSKTSESLSIDASISKEAKQYALLYNFWVPDGLFPLTPKLDVDPHSPTHWTSPKAKLDGAVAELYSVVPSSLHKHMETYKQFGSIIKQSNILRAIKDCAGIVFAPYGLDPTHLSGRPLGRKEDPKFQVLLKKDGIGEYMHLAPILFKKNDNMVASKFLMSLAITLAHFLVSPDLELSSISGETHILYSSDHDFYIEKLSKKSNWALHVFDHVNCEVFGKDSQSKNVSLVPPVPPTAQPCTQEDEMLSEIKNPTPHVTAPTSPTVNTFVNPAFLNPPSASLWGFDMATCSSSSTSSCHGNTLSVSMVSQLQLEVGQLSVSSTCTTPALSLASSQQTMAPTSCRKITPVATQQQESSHAAKGETIVDLPEPLQCTTHNTTHAGKVLKTKK